MSRLSKSLLIIAAVTTIGLGSSVEAISKVPRHLNVLSVYGGYASPVGTVDGVTGVPDEIFPPGAGPFGLDASDVYNSTFYLGASLGQVRSGHYLCSLGFRFTKHEIKDTVSLPLDYIWITDPSFHLRQYDLNFAFNYHLNDLNQISWTPWLGLGIQTGLTTARYSGYSSESELKAALSLNFGFDLKLWHSSDKRTFVALSSANDYIFWGSDERPPYLNLGAAIRIYGRP